MCITEQCSQLFGVVLEGAPTVCGESDVADRGAPLVRLRNENVVGILESAQMCGEVTGRHLQQFLQSREGDLIFRFQRRKSGNDAQPSLRVDDRIEVIHARALVSKGAVDRSAPTTRSTQPR